MIGMYVNDCRFDAESLATLKSSFVELKLLDSEPDMSKLYTEQLSAEIGRRASDPRAEFGNGGGEDVGLLLDRQMAAARHDGQARAADRLVPRLAIGERQIPIVLARDDMGRKVDAIDPVQQLRIVVAMLPGKLHDGAAIGLTHGFVGRRKGAQHRVIG